MMTASESSNRSVVIGSDRSFGLIFAVFFSLIALFPVMKGEPVRWWALVIALIFAALARFVPRVLNPLNRAWFAFGILLHRVVNPVIMALIFYGSILPMGLLLRALGKDILRLRIEPQVLSYWIPRQSPAPAPKSMSKQF